MRLDPNVKDELIDLYNNLRDAQENYKAATDAAAQKIGAKAAHVRMRVRLEATGKLHSYHDEVQLVLAL